MCISIGALEFKTQKACEEHTRNLLREMGETKSVKLKNEAHFRFLSLLCKRHPAYADKMKKFVDFQINFDARNARALALTIVNDDNTTTEISWRICVKGKGKTTRELFHAALRQSVSWQIRRFRDESDLTVCQGCKKCIQDTHIDHEIQFAELVNDFMENTSIIMPIEYDKKEISFEVMFQEKDRCIGDQFSEYHASRATLRVLCPTCNLTRKKFKAPF